LPIFIIILIIKMLCSKLLVENELENFARGLRKNIFSKCSKCILDNNLAESVESVYFVSPTVLIQVRILLHQ
jgi:hypothetical protein